MAAAPQPNGFLRLLRFVVVVAAGVGGWFAYDEYVVADSVELEVTTDVVAPGEFGAPAPQTPWPADLILATSAWEGGHVATVQPADDIVRQQMEYDASGPVKMTLFAPDGSVSATVESDGISTWVDIGNGWEQPSQEGETSESSLRRAAYTAPAPTMTDLLPPETWPYTQLLGEAPGTNGSRVLSFRVKGAAFADEQPASAAQWRNNAYFENSFGPLELDIEVDVSGHIVGVSQPNQDVGGVLFRFAPLAAAPTFTSPIVD